MNFSKTKQGNSVVGTNAYYSQKTVHIGHSSKYLKPKDIQIKCTENIKQMCR